jgi:hypothetical protein
LNFYEGKEAANDFSQRPLLPYIDTVASRYVNGKDEQIERFGRENL